MNLSITGWNKILRQLIKRAFKWLAFGQRRGSQWFQSQAEPLSLVVESLETRLLLSSTSEIEMENGDVGMGSSVTIGEFAEQIYVVDKKTDSAFGYHVDGAINESFSLQNAKRSRGAAVSSDGSRLFVLNSNRVVYVFDTETDTPIGSWKAKGISGAQGITTYGDDIWVVDRNRDKVHFFEDAAHYDSGTYLPTNNFKLNANNRRPTGISTDGEHFWVVDRGSDSVFVYDSSGGLLGEWFLDEHNRRPSGIAATTNSNNGLWVLDAQDDEIYHYLNGQDIRSGAIDAANRFLLSFNNQNGAGVAIGPVYPSQSLTPPTIQSIDEDSGENAADQITNDNRLAISGIADPGSQVSVELSAVGFLGLAITDSDGLWNLDSQSVTIPDGQYVLTATASIGSETSQPSEEFPVTIDTASPSHLSINGILHDTGIDNSDGVTNNSQIVIRGSSEANVEIELLESSLGIARTANTDDLGNWIVDLSSLEFDDGIYQFDATATDVAGNQTSLASPFEVTVDTAAPIAPTLNLASEYDSGLIGDHITSYSSVTLNGHTEAGAVVHLAETAATTIADSNGDFEFTDVNLIIGTNTFTVTASDIAGNTSTLIQDILREQGDTSEPIVSVSLLNDTGPSSNDKFTTDPTLIGSILPAETTTATLTIFAPDSPLEFSADLDSELDSNNNFELDRTWFESLVGFPLPLGRYEYQLLVVDTNEISTSILDEFTLIENDTDDITPPIVSLALLNDTGSDSTDQITSDATLVGTVFDESPVVLELQIFDYPNDELTTSPVTDLLKPDGSLTITPERIEQILGRSLQTGYYDFSLTAYDQYTYMYDYVSVKLDFVPSPPSINAISNDTGSSDGDGITRDSNITLQGTADAGTIVQLSGSYLGEIGSTVADYDGNWSFEIGQTVADGDYEIQAVSISEGGQISEASDSYTITIDTNPPPIAEFDLDPLFDTGEVGDSYTTLNQVGLVGMTIANAQVKLLNSNQSTVSDSNGRFTFSNVNLELGRHIYLLETIDEAGNSSITQKSLAFDQPAILSDTEFVSRQTQLVDLSPDSAARKIIFQIASDFGHGPTETPDSFQVYLVNQNDPTVTLIDRGENGTSLFSMIGDQYEHAPGLVQFDGQTVQIDVSGLEQVDQGLLVFELINNNSNNSTQIQIFNIGANDVANEAVDLASNQFNRTDPGGSLDTSGLIPSENLSATYENIHYDPVSKRFAADLRIQNNGADIGRAVVASFDSLPDGVSLLNASGVNEDGIPYINFQAAIPNYGLLESHSSDAIRIVFTAPSNSPILFPPKLLHAGVNSTPTLNPIEPLDVFPGEVRRIDLSTTDTDGLGHYFALGNAINLPNIRLTSQGQLVIAPEPDQIGEYNFDVVVSDGIHFDSQSVSLNVIADPVTTTRISGVVLDTNSAPLSGIPITLGNSEVLTEFDGTFELSFTGSLPDDTLLIHGNEFAGDEEYPFVAEKLSLLLGHDAFGNINNQVERPIFLPALDVANSVEIDPLTDVTVITDSIPNASVFVAAGTLLDQEGNQFTGALSITEVPADFTPAALPPNLFPDLVVTIQPGEMVFTTPAPLNLPNLAGYVPGTEMTLWSINPNTGLFDDVGSGVVSDDGSTVATITGGIINSSWHFFSPGGPDLRLDNPRNLNKECDDCEEKDDPNSNPVSLPSSNNQGAPFSDGSDGGTTLDDVFDGDGSTLDDVLGGGSGTTIDEILGGDSPSVSSDLFGGQQNAGGNGPTTSGPLDTSFLDPHFYPGNPPSLPAPIAAPISSSFLPGWMRQSSNTSPENHPLIHGNETNTNDTRSSFHSGAIHKSHELVPYKSLETWRGLQLNYDSERADARPIVSSGFDNVQNNLSDPILVSKLTYTHGNTTVEVPGYVGSQAGLTGGEHFFGIPDNATSLDIAIQADLRHMPTGVYDFESTNRFATNTTGSFVGPATIATERLVHVNTSLSPFGAGWGLVGLTSIVENVDGSVLLVDGDGGEFLFEAPNSNGESYISPGGDFSTLGKLADGRFRRTHTDQTVEEFGVTNRLISITDRNGNQTQFVYDNDDHIKQIIDPVGMITTFRYTNGKVTEIEDPAGRITTLNYENGDLISIQDPDASTRQFAYDSAHRLISETDKRGNVESFEYGFSGRIESITRRDGTAIHYSPVQTQALYRPDQTARPDLLLHAQDLGSQAVSHKIDPNGNVTRIELDKHGQLLEASDGEGELPEVSRTENNLTERIVDGRGNLTLIDYDERGNVISISDPISRGVANQTLFANPVYAVHKNATQIVAADLNNDGFDDIVSENGFSGNSVSVLINNRSGGFHAPVDYETEKSTGLTVADFNQDGQLDVAVSNLNDLISIMTGNGDGTLNNEASFTAGDRPKWIQSADLNNDGFIDLISADESDDAVSIYLGDGSGQFVTRSSFSVAGSPDVIAVADLDNDDVTDLVVANNSFTNSLSILLGNGDGTFQTSSFISLTESSRHLSLGDVTGDGIADIVSGSSNILILAGHGDGTFAPEQIVTTNTSSGITRSELSDVDNDNDLDLIITKSSINSISIWNNDGSGQFLESQSIGTDANPVSTIPIDFNLDGRIDLISLNTDSDTLTPFGGHGDGTFEIPEIVPNDSFAVGNGPTIVEVVDVNSDGHNDFVVGSQLDNSIAIFAGDNTGNVNPLNQISATGLLVSLDVGDLNQDGNVDLVTAHYDTDQLEVRFGEGNGYFSNPTTIPIAAGPLQVKLGDFDNDSYLDIAATGHKGGSDATYTIVRNNGDGTFGDPVNSIARFKNQTIDVGDIDNDGNLDLVIGQTFFSSGNAARVFLGAGDGSFVDQGRIAFGGGFFSGAPKELKLVDLDDDGNLDIVGLDDVTRSLRVLKGNGNSSFEPVVAYPLDEGVRKLEVGDVNQDGILDVISTNELLSRISVYLGQNDGTFGERFEFAANDGTVGIALVDFDNDGTTDIVTTSFEDDNLSIHYNLTDLGTQSSYEYEYDSIFNQITSTIDEEGRETLYQVDPLTGNTVSITQVIGEVGGDDDVETSFTYTPAGLIDTSTDPLGRITDFDYNAQGLVESITFAVGTEQEASRTFEYDAAGNLTARIDELGHRTEYAFDSLNRRILIVEADPDGDGPLHSPETTFVYDSHGNLIESIDALNNSNQFVYDAQNRLIETVDANSQSIFHSYDQAGNLTETTDRLGRRTTFAYDNRNRLVETINADHGRSSKFYDDDNNVVQVFDENGVISTIVYDARNRVVRTIDAHGGIVSFEYDRVDNLVAVTDEIGRRSDSKYDELNRLTSTTRPDPDGDGPESFPVTDFSYDKASNLRYITDPLGNTTELVYDSRNRLIQWVQPDPDGIGPAVNPITTYLFDSANRLIEILDPLSRVTVHEYDDLNRKIRTISPDPDGAGPEVSPVTSYTYDAVDQLLEMVDPLGNSTRYDYDVLYRMTRLIESDPDDDGPLNSPTSEYFYDAEGQIIGFSDPLDRVTTFEYDSLGRLIKRTLPDPDLQGAESSPTFTYTYDSVGNEISMTDALGNATRYIYDNLYRLIATIKPDPDGDGSDSSPVITNNFDAAHQLTSVTDALGRTTTYVYDSLGRIIELALPDPDGIGSTPRSITTMKYDLAGNEITRIDSLGNITRFEYDNLYRQTKVIEPAPDESASDNNPITSFEYDAADQLTSITDPLNRTTQYVFDDLGRVVVEIKPDPDQAGPLSAPATTLAFDLMNNVVSMTDSLGNTTHYEYDNLYRKTMVVGPDPDGLSGPAENPISIYKYDAASQLTSQTDSLGRTTIFSYDNLGRVVREIYPDPDDEGDLQSPEMALSYDLMNNILSSTDALGNVTSYEYDNLYRQTKITRADPDGDGPKTSPTTNIVYDLEDQITSITDPLNRTTDYVYDDLGRIVKEIYPDPDDDGPMQSPSMTIRYDLMSNRVESTDALGFATEYEYDQLYRLVKIIGQDPDESGPQSNPITSFAYDLGDQLVMRADPLHRTTRYQYDDLGRLIVIIEPDPDGSGSSASPMTWFTYDSVGNRLSVTDANGNTTKYTYDNLYRLTEELGEDLDGSGPLGQPLTSFKYDLEDNLVSLTDTLGNTTTYSYDGLNRKIRETIDLGLGNFSSRTFEYDAMNNLIREQDRNERVIAYEYDDLNRRVNEHWLDEQFNLVNSIQFDFDNASQLLSVTDAYNDSQRSYEYDNLGRTTGKTIDDGGAVVVFEHDYDLNNRLLTQTATVDTALDFQNSYEYDGLNRRISQSQSSLTVGLVADKRVDYIYNSDSQLTMIQRYGDLNATSLVSSTEYDYDGIGRLASLTHQSEENSFAGYEFTYDSGHRIIGVDSIADGFTQYSFDNTNQLQAESPVSLPSVDYEYDENGNRANSGHTTGYYNRLLSDANFSFEYDDEGNLSSRTNIATGEFTEYFWDHRNRLIGIQTSEFFGGPVVYSVVHRYDAYNQWIATSVDHDGEGPDPSVSKGYVYGSGQIVLEFDDSFTLSHRYFWGPDTDQLIADETVDGQLLWAHGDHLNSVRDLLISDGTVVNHITYDGFGNVTAQTNPEFHTMFGFTSRPFDSSTGLQNNLNRWYDSTTGRWISEDPISFAAGDPNLYRYVGNNSINEIDPEGLETIWRQVADFGSRFGSRLVDNLGGIGSATGDLIYNRARPVIGDAVAIAATAGYSRINQTIGRKDAARNTLAVSRKIKESSLLYNPSADIQNEIRMNGAAATRQKLQNALQYAQISDSVYKVQVGDRIGDFVAKKTWTDSSTGFRAGLFLNKVTCEWVLGYAGTDSGPEDSDFWAADWIQNIQQGLGARTDQYEQAIELARRVKTEYGAENLTLAGHSLGGGLASAAALVNDLPAKVVDPAGVHSRTLERHGANFDREYELIDAVRLWGEGLTSIENLAAGWPMPDARGNLLTIPTRSNIPLPVTNHGSTLMVETLKELLGNPY